MLAFPSKFKRIKSDYITDRNTYWAVDSKNEKPRVSKYSSHIDYLKSCRNFKVHALHIFKSHTSLARFWYFQENFILLSLTEIIAVDGVRRRNSFTLGRMARKTCKRTPLNLPRLMHVDTDTRRKRLCIGEVTYSVHLPWQGSFLFEFCELAIQNYKQMTVPNNRTYITWVLSTRNRK